MFSTPSVAWQALQTHADTLSQTHISSLFGIETERFERYTFEQKEILLDLSKQRITPETLTLLIQLAEERSLPSWINDLFNGEHVNDSEDRPALHTALRAPVDSSVTVRGNNIISEVHDNLARMGENCSAYTFWSVARVYRPLNRYGGEHRCRWVRLRAVYGLQSPVRESNEPSSENQSSLCILHGWQPISRSP